MRTIKTSEKEINDFVDSLFANGRSPSEAFGTSWQQLSQFEADHPQITVKTDSKTQKTA